MGVPVILDGGASVEIAAIDCGSELRIGMRFAYGGRIWEITHAKDVMRGWVARPVCAREPR